MVVGTTHPQDIGTAAVRDIDNILQEKDRAKVMNEILEWRLEHIIPELMRRERIDMWLIICREYNEDPVYLTLVPEPTMAARRTSILIFHDKGEEEGVARLTGSFYGMGKWYKSIFTDQSKDQFEVLAEYIKESAPKKIGINESETWAFGDGLSASFKASLIKALGPELSARLVSAENLCVGWLETRSPRELSLYRHICGIAHDIIAEFFSNQVIVPDATTTEDVVWWIRQRITGLGLEPWFQPSVSIQRSKKDSELYKDNPRVIRRGDLLHCDVGIVYLGLCTDTQENAYVCRIGETDAPEGLKEALRRGNRLQDIVMAEHRFGRTGNEVLSTSLEKAKAEGLTPAVYCHPLGVHGHAAGFVVGLWNRQDGVPVRGDYPLYYNTCYAIEMNNKYEVPEWNNQEIRMGLEEGGVFTKGGCHFIDGRQTKLFLIK
ncbi:MAG: M24 family metallopeptidase [Candidatus Aminicenantes bacterium]|nr:MAG: M24 family metallopeptidase [Candidatus Aminicenantes bacterium]